mgnify:FL=1
MNELLAEKNLKVRLTEAAVEHLVEQGFDAKMGARPLARKINELIKVPLSKKILFESVPEHSVVVADFVNGEIVFDIQAAVMPVLPTIDSNGYIILDQIES